MRRGLRSLLVLALALGCGEVEERSPVLDGRPNILFILVDDLRWDALGSEGNPDVRTPTLDRLAEEGVRLDRYYVANPVCNASRASLLTGLHTRQRGLRRLKINVKLREGTPTVANVLGEAGYVTGFIGKAHMGGDPRPWGFAETPLYHPGHQVPDGDEAWTRWFEDGREVHIEDDSTARTMDAAITFIEAHREHRWFLWLATTSPHFPYHYHESHPYEPKDLSPPPGYPPSDPFGNRRLWADYYSSISHLDAQIGRLLAVLDAAGLRERTLVVFTSDNGLMNGSHGWPWKGVWFEESVRQPAIWRWPGTIPQGERRGDPVVSVDLLPTFVEIGGARLPEGLDGRSVLGLLRGGPGPRRYAFSESTLIPRAGGGTWNMIRDARYKYVDFVDRPDRHLYDLSIDPYEQSDRAEDPALADVEQRLAGALEAWRARTR